jgi:2',3'-cyclic-nucleotide 2'-phosphodiesterase (5'-nucleotidase family)
MKVTTIKPPIPETIVTITMTDHEAKLLQGVIERFSGTGNHLKMLEDLCYGLKNSGISSIKATYLEHDPRLG